MRKITLRIIIILAGVAICLAVAFFLTKSANENILNSCGRDDWNQYSDNVFGFTVCHPSELTATALHDGDITYGTSPGRLDPNGGVSFSANNKGVFGVKVYNNPPVASLDEWLKFVNVDGEKYRKENETAIDGNEAMVTYLVSVMAGQEELFINEKRTVFFKDGNLFEIWTSFYGDDNAPQSVWDSFHFVNK